MEEKANDTIHCPIGKWYFKRMALLGLLLLGFGGWFLYDGAIGFPKGSVKAVAYEAFGAGKASTWEEYTSREGSHFSEANLDAEALEKVESAHAAGGGKTTWEDFAIKRKFDVSEPAPGGENFKLFQAFKAGGADEADWKTYAAANNLPEDPSAMAQRDDQVDALYNAFENAGKSREWAPYAAANDLPTKEPHFYGKSDIIEQYVIGGLCAVGGLVTLGIMLMNRGREVKADGDAYYPKANVKVPFADVFKVDTRKWRRKGLAYAFYKDGGSEKKAVLDDLKFAGSQAILDRIVDRFEGDLIEEVVLDELEEESVEAAGEAEKAVPEDS